MRDVPGVPSMSLLTMNSFLFSWMSTSSGMSGTLSAKRYLMIKRMCSNATKRLIRWKYDKLWKKLPVKKTRPQLVTTAAVDMISKMENQVPG
jgi:hypothetical protein